MSMSEEEIKERENINKDAHSKLAKNLGNDQKNVLNFISGKYSYDPQVSWKCNLGRILWYVHPDIKDAFTYLNDWVNMYLQDNEVRLKLTSIQGAEHPLEYDDPLMYEILSLYFCPGETNKALFRERGIDYENSLVRRTIWSVLTCLKVTNIYFRLIYKEHIYRDSIRI